MHIEISNIHNVTDDIRSKYNRESKPYKNIKYLIEVIDDVDGMVMLYS